MKDVYEMLRHKEMDCARLRKEIDALRLAIPLLAEDEPAAVHNQENVAAEKTGTDGPNSLPFDHTKWNF